MENNLPCLTNVLQIRSLPPSEAQKELPVKLSGVITFCDARPNDLFFQDATAGIYVVLNPNAGDKLSAGQALEILGVTDVGDFAPVVKARSVRVTGSAPLPTARRVTMDQLFTGKEDSQLIEVSGVVRSATVLADRNYLNLAMDGQRLRVSIKSLGRSNATHLISQYIGTLVRVRGVCYSRYNSLGQFWLPWVAVASLDDVTIESRSSSPPALVSIDDLARFNTSGYHGNRVKICGVVTLQKDDGEVFIQENGKGLCVLLAQPVTLKPGEQIEVTGYAALGDYIPILEDATVEVLGRGQPPSPITVDLKSLLELPEKYDYLLVHVEANLMNSISGMAEQTLVLDASNTVLTAGIANAQANETVKSLRHGSQLGLTGIFIAQSPSKWIPGFIPSREKPGSNPFYLPPESVQVLLRTPEDVVVLHQPPWWTLARLLWLVGIMMLVLVIGLALVVALDRRVRQQTQIITEKVRREGMMEERDRLAREFHDTLEQELVAITMQLDAVKAQSTSTSPRERRHLELARSMARRSLSEAKRSVWALSSHMLENGTLETALKGIADALFQETGIELLFSQRGAPRKLSALTEHNLLRVGQEALANAFKHSCAKKINVCIDYEPDLVRLSIHDDGRGFDIGSANSARHGHFGLLDMRERAEKIGGQFSLTSHRDDGTKLSITVLTTPNIPESNYLANGTLLSASNGNRTTTPEPLAYGQKNSHHDC